MPYCPHYNQEVYPGLVISSEIDGRKQQTRYRNPSRKSTKTTPNKNDCVAKTTAEKAQDIPKHGGLEMRRRCQGCLLDVTSAVSNSPDFNQHSTQE